MYVPLMLDLRSRSTNVQMWGVLFIYLLLGWSIYLLRGWSTRATMEIAPTTEMYER